ncbi:MAG: hypothetical protein AB1405_07840 [Bdellovibrionota bacterium]
MADRPAVGTLAWVRETGGILSRGERFSLLTKALVRQLAMLPAQLRWRLGLVENRAPLEVSDIKAPDSALAKKAEEACRTQAPFIANHALRTYLWGRLFAAADGVRFDDELFYVASLCHDLGLKPAEGRVSHPAGCSCFTLASAERAVGLAKGVGWNDGKCEHLGSAITLHMNPVVNRSEGAEAYLLAQGVGLDVVGARAWDLGRDQLKAVATRHPREGFKKKFADTFEAEGKANPGSRTDFMMRYLMVGVLIRTTPFAE